MQAGAWRNREPVALGWRAVGRFVAVDEAKPGLSFACRDVKSDPAAVSKLGVEPWSHRFADERVALAFDQQLGDAALQRFGFVLAGLVVLSSGRG